MKKTALAIVLASALGFATAADAAFVDGYALDNWSTSLGGGGGVTSATSNVLALWGASNWSGTFNVVDLTITALGSGVVSFDWHFLTFDLFGARWDPFGYLLNGMFTQLTSDGGPRFQAGSTSFLVEAGDTFGFSQRSLDSRWGRGVTTVSSFSGPSANRVPEPATLALLGIGLAGLGVLRRRRAV